VAFLTDLVTEARAAIENGSFDAWSARWSGRYTRTPQPEVSCTT
jgi:queuine/archaeosine tRNA-ribosyltransferase